MDGCGYIVFLSYFARGLEPYVIIGLSMDGHRFIVFLSYFARGLEPATMPSLDYPWMVADTLYS